MWKYRVPSPGDYDSDEEYQDALAAYEYAESQYIDEYIEMHHQ